MARNLRQTPEKQESFIKSRHSDRKTQWVVSHLCCRSKRVVRFYNGRGTAEQWIKEGKNAVKWAKLSCRAFKGNQARLQLFALACNLANFLRRLAVPKSVSHWTLTTLRENLIKIGAKVTRHSKYVTFQLGEAPRTKRRKPPSPHRQMHGMRFSGAGKWQPGTENPRGR